MTLSRRRFLGAAGVAAGGAAIGATAWAALVRDQAEQAAPNATTSPTTTPSSTFATNPDRLLVVVQCNGGNDALNTLVPVIDGAYRDARPNLALDEAAVLPLTETYGLHPSLAPLVPMWERQHLAFVQSVGFANQTRSHFDAMDTWWSADPAEPTATGWLGRWNDLTQDGSNPLRMISLGANAPALIGERTLATAVADPAGFSLRARPGVDAETLADAYLATARPLARGELMAAAQAAVPASLEAVGLLAEASGGEDADPSADTEVTFTSLLETAAGILELGTDTQVIMVGHEGFDTHAEQSQTHGDLLADVGTGLSQFLDRVGDMGRADDVLVITTSEFGRRVAENGSGGTDHGAAGTMLVCGNGVSGQIAGDLDLVALVDGDLAVGIDTRSLYATAIEWLSDSTVAEEVLGGPYDTYGLLA
jgi:uncharacterized protein (DUF1501 family)